MSSEAPGPLDTGAENRAKSSESCEIFNGNRFTKAPSDRTCNHKASKLHNGQSKSNSNPKHGSVKDSKKSLSFFSSVEYSEESSVQSEGVIESGSHNSVKVSKIGDVATADDVAKLKRKTKSATQDEHETSSTSSCSCEDHSSVAGHSDEDPHGDLDYDDDSMNGSPSHRREQHSEDTSEPLSSSVNEVLTNPREQRSISSPIAEPSLSRLRKVDHDSNGEDVDNQNNESNDQRKPTKIRSFINFDRGLGDNEPGKSDATIRKSAKDRSHKSYESLLKYFFKDACYFQIKSINHENVELSKSMKVWSTPMQNEIRLNTAFREHRNVILIFSVQQSGAFQGFARMVSESRPSTNPVPWVLPERLSSSALGGVFRVEWLCTKELNFNETKDLYNPFNNNKPVKVARDGQQVEPKVGRRLCSLFSKDSKKDLLASVQHLKHQTRMRKQLSQKKSGYYPLDDARSRGSVQNRYPQLGSVNGFVEVSDPSTASHARFMYANGPYVGPSRQPPNSFRRVGGMSNHHHNHHHQMMPGQYQRQRVYPLHVGDVFNDQRPNHYDQHMTEMAPGFGPGVNEEYYSAHYGTNYTPYMGPMQHPTAQPPHSRAYHDWNMTAMNPHRFHPYQRPRR